MRLTKRAPRGALVILAMLVASLAIAACGGSSGAGKTTTSKNAASTSTAKSASAGRSAFTSCLKQHGVTLPTGRQGGFGFRRNGASTTGAPPAGGGGAGPTGGGFGGGGGGFAGGTSKFAKAFQACRSKLGSSGFGQGRFGAGGPGRPQLHPALRGDSAEVVRLLHPKERLSVDAGAGYEQGSEVRVPRECREERRVPGCEQEVPEHPAAGIRPARGGAGHDDDVDDDVQRVTGL